MWYDIIDRKGGSMSDFYTIADYGSDEFTEKKSKFIGYIKHIETEEEAAAFISEIKGKHWDAKHNVYAYVIGENGTTQRSTDDGEPAGTAGRPVLEVIKGENLTNVVVLVTRYFGGVLLGTGGLVRAYGKAAKMAIEAAKIVRPVRMKTVAICADYDLMGKIQNFLIQKEIVIDHIEYQNNAMIYCLIEEERVPQFSEILEQQFQMKLPCTILNQDQWHYVPV